MAAASPLLAALFGDADMAARINDRALVAAMLRVVAALAQAQAARGVIPNEACDVIVRAAASLELDPEALAPAVAVAGIPAQPVIAALKQAAGEAGDWAHFGATSQDVQDSALALLARDALALLEMRLTGLSAALADQAARWADLPIPARTRFQDAAPTTLGAKIAIWRAPLTRCADRLAELRPRVLGVSLSGAAGTGAAFGLDAADLRADVAARLELGVPEAPWHAARDSVAELAGWLSLVTGALGKMGFDLTLLAQSGQVRAGREGGSSTLPQKRNPVGAEALVTLARLNANDVAAMHQALVHAQERDGTALGVEWLTLPAMLERAAAALRIGRELADSLVADRQRIAAHFAMDRGAMMAEAAGFLLARDMPRSQALALARAALAEMEQDGRLTLAEALTRRAPGRDWAALLAPENNLGEAPILARSVSSREDH